MFPLTTEKKKFEWTEKATQAVEALKKATLEAPVLAKLDRELPTRVTTDASYVGIGAVLEQQHGNQWRPVAFWSRKLKDAETRYSVTDIEWLAVVDAVTLIWRYMLEDIPFLIRADHKALERKLMKSAQDPLCYHDTRVGSNASCRILILLNISKGVIMWSRTPLVVVPIC